MFAGASAGHCLRQLVASHPFPSLPCCRGQVDAVVRIIATAAHTGRRLQQPNWQGGQR